MKLTETVRPHRARGLRPPGFVVLDGKATQSDIVHLGVPATSRVLKGLKIRQSVGKVRLRRAWLIGRMGGGRVIIIQADNTSAHFLAELCPLTLVIYG